MLGAPSTFFLCALWVLQQGAVDEGDDPVLKDSRAASSDQDTAGEGPGNQGTALGGRACQVFTWKAVLFTSGPHEVDQKGDCLTGVFLGRGSKVRRGGGPGIPNSGLRLHIHILDTGLLDSPWALF